MAVIVPGIVPPPAAPTNGPGRTDAVYAKQWRKTLEQAQWAAGRDGGRRSGQTAQGGGEAAEASPAGTSFRPSVGAAPMRAAMPPGAYAQPATGIPGSRADSAVSRIASAVSAGLDAEALPLASAVPGATLLAREATRAMQPRAAAPARALPQAAALPEWPDATFTASMTPDGVSVVLRDADLDEDGAVTLFHRLRSRLAAGGHALASLIVNGREVSPESAGGARS